MENLNDKYMNKAEELLSKVDYEADGERRKLVLALSLACAGFEGAFGVWEERFELMKDLLQKYPPPPKEPPDCGSMVPTRRCWWCGK